MPAAGVAKLSHDDILSYEELLRIARAAVAIGIEKIRITGGEPLLRRDILGFLTKLAAIADLRHLVLTTNGILLEEMAEGLWRAGVQRLNISLDSLRPDRFAGITRGGDLQRVLAGIKAAQQVGFPLKINMVVMAGINDDELLEFAALTLDTPLMVRFIEFMPAQREENWQSVVVPGKSIIDQLSRRYTLATEDKEHAAGPARSYRIAGAAGTIGVITPITGHFCRECNRIRVSAAGKARGCLLVDSVQELKPIVATGDEAALRAALTAVIAIKPQSHMLTIDGAAAPFDMSAIGG